MIVDKKRHEEIQEKVADIIDGNDEPVVDLKNLTVEEAVKVNALSETYLALRSILEKYMLIQTMKIVHYCLRQ